MDDISEAIMAGVEEMVDPSDTGTFEATLQEYGYMIVPIDDPTNFLSRRDEDD